MAATDDDTAIPDDPANRELPTWIAIISGGCPKPPGVNLDVLVPLSAVAETQDRVCYGVWGAGSSRVPHKASAAGD